MSQADDWTAPPTTILVPDVDGPLMWAEVYRNGRLVGAVWMAEDRTMIPRCGIVNVPDPDGYFQDELGMLTLGLRDNRDLDAAEFIDYMSESRDGAHGRLMVGNGHRAMSLDDVRRATGLIP